MTSPAHTYAVFHNIGYELYEVLPTPTPSTTTTPVPTLVPSTTTPTSTPIPTATATPAPNQGNSTIPPATGNTVNRSTAESFATRCYELVLDRTPDATGFNNWTNSLVNNQNTGANMVYGFFFSQEFINRNLTNEEYVATLYRVFLGREPDQAGFDNWVSQLNNGADRLSIFRGFAHSQEYTNICSSYGIDRGSI